MTAIAVATTSTQRVRVPDWYGGAAELMACMAQECCMDGPAGTGKSFAALWKMHLRRCLFAGSRGLLARKTLISLKSSTLVTYKAILGPMLDAGLVKFWTARADEPAHYAYWNGSKVVIAGLDKPGEAMSTEYDDVLIDEALDCEEADVEALLTRIRRPGHVYEIGSDVHPPYAQLVMVTNPGPPAHWLNERMNSGRTVRLLSRHEDNPAMTQEYLDLLAGSLTGVRRERLLEGRWAAAENVVYDEWDAAVHLIPSFPIPGTWPRYMAIDFGYTNPTVVQWWAVDGDGRLYLYRELVVSERTVDQIAEEVNRLNRGEPLPRLIFADPEDKGGRVVFTRVTRMPTLPAKKDRINGIQTVKARLRVAGDGRPRLYVLKGSLVHRDPKMLAAKRPIGFAAEIDSYAWDTRNNRARGEEPIDTDNHSMDAGRYVCMGLDAGQGTAFTMPSLY